MGKASGDEHGCPRNLIYGHPTLTYTYFACAMTYSSSFDFSHNYLQMQKAFLLMVMENRGWARFAPEATAVLP